MWEMLPTLVSELMGMEMGKGYRTRKAGKWDDQYIGGRKASAEELR